MDEILCITKTCKRAETGVTELIDEMEERGIIFAVRREDFSVETPNYRVIFLPINGNLLMKSRQNVKYFTSCGVDLDALYWLYFPQDAKEIENEKCIIDILEGIYE